MSHDSVPTSLALVFAAAISAPGCPEEPAGPEATATACSDGADNDGDGRVDCADPDCAPFCGGDGDADGDAETDGDGDADGDADAVADADLDADLDADRRPPIISCTGDRDCPPLLRCYDYALDGETICAPRGASCLDPADCGPGVDCGLVAEWAGSGTFCRVTREPCDRDGQCPDGYRCEGEACVDRRVRCADNRGCPWWDLCGPLRSGLRVCLPAAPESCADEEECSEPAACVDADGDGDRECQPTTGSTCVTNADCEGSVCGEQDGLRGLECGPVGPCLTSGDCPGTMECVDANGAGDLECQPAGGECTTDRDCPPRRLCWDRDRAGGAECVGEA